ncbi:MAG: LysM domain-containing protein [Gammaproteobacteria bacterium]|nr:MAG: LysM domain-containing protein [Gammaproteobacteria bacterium]
MYMKSLLIAALALSVGLVRADTLALAEGHPESYTVVKGDTLWDIAGRFLEQPWRWPEIWQVNPQIENPHLIYPGDVIRLVWRDGRPALQLERGGVAVGGREVKLAPRVRAEKHDRAIPALPLDAIDPFLRRLRVVTAGEYESAPYVVSSFEEHLVAGTGNTLYVRGLDPDSTGQRYAVFRRGDPYYDYSEEGRGELLGYEALHVGEVSLQRSGDPASMQVLRATREILVGDRLYPHSEEPLPLFQPHAPDRPVRGRIISAPDVVSQIGQYQVVVLNRGVRDGLEAGHVLAIYQSGRVVRDTIGTEPDARSRERQQREYEAGRIRFERADSNLFDGFAQNLANDVRDNWLAFRKWLQKGRAGVEVELPEERIGELMVFRAYDRVSYALVMGLSAPAHIYDAVANP